MAAHEPMDDPRRRVLVRALTLGLIGAGIPLESAAFLGSRPGRLPSGRNIFRIRGQVLVNDVPASIETRVRPGDTVKTGPDSECIFAIDGHSMILRSNSTLTLEAQQRADQSVFVRGLRMLAGALLQVSRDASISVGTANALIGIRGTGFYVEAEPQQTYFCTCYGVTEVASATDPESREVITARHHDRPVYILSDGERGKRIRNAPFINHTDQELALIEALVGRTPPFNFPKDSYSGPRRGY